MLVVPIICWTLVLVGKGVILFWFVFQCTHYRQLNYDLTTTYSVLTRMALGRLSVTMLQAVLSMIYDSLETPVVILLEIAFALSLLSAGLHLAFFVLRLYMTFLHSNYQVSKCNLMCYAFIIAIAMSSYLVYYLLAFDFIEFEGVDDDHQNQKDATLNVLFVVSEAARLLVLCLVSLQFVAKLISLGVKHYSPSTHELQGVSLVADARAHETQMQPTNGMVNIGGAGVVRVKDHQSGRNVVPFSVVQMDLIKIVSKQTLLAMIDFVVLFVYIFIGLFEASEDPNSSFFGRNVYPVFLALQYLVTSLTIWLSFEFANKEYQVIFGKCDTCCLKCAAYATTKVEAKQRTVVGYRFTL